MEIKEEEKKEYMEMLLCTACEIFEDILQCDSPYHNFYKKIKFWVEDNIYSRGSEADAETEPHSSVTPSA